MNSQKFEASNQTNQHTRRFAKQIRAKWSEFAQKMLYEKFRDKYIATTSKIALITKASQSN